MQWSTEVVGMEGRADNTLDIFTDLFNNLVYVCDRLALMQ